MRAKGQSGGGDLVTGGYETGAPPFADWRGSQRLICSCEANMLEWKLDLEGEKTKTKARSRNR